MNASDNHLFQLRNAEHPPQLLLMNASDNHLLHQLRNAEHPTQLPLMNASDNHLLSQALSCLQHNLHYVLGILNYGHVIFEMWIPFLSFYHLATFSALHVFMQL